MRDNRFGILLIALLILIFSVTSSLIFYKFNYKSSLDSYCRQKALDKLQILQQKTVYEIVSTSVIGKGLVLEVKDWGKVKFQVSKSDYSQCNATTHFLKLQDEIADAWFATVSLKSNLNSKASEIVEFYVDLTAYAKRVSDEKYDFETLLQDITDRYSLERITDSNFKVSFKNFSNDTEKEEAFDKLRGEYHLIKRENFPVLITKDSGETWAVE